MQVIMINISQTANNLSRAFQKFEGSTDKLLHEEFEFAKLLNTSALEQNIC